MEYAVMMTCEWTDAHSSARRSTRVFLMDVGSSDKEYDVMLDALMCFRTMCSIPSTTSVYVTMFVAKPNDRD